MSDSASHAAASHAAHAHQGPSYFTIFLLLIVMTGVTVGVSYINFGTAAGVLIALAIATFKASLVAMFFMHLKTEVRSLYIVVGFPMLLMVVMFVALLIEKF